MALSEEQVLLLLNKYGQNVQVRNGVIDSKHHSYKRKKRIGNDIEISNPEELEAAYKQFYKDFKNEE